MVPERLRPRDHERLFVEIISAGHPYPDGSRPPALHITTAEMPERNGYTVALERGDRRSLADWLAHLGEKEWWTAELGVKLAGIWGWLSAERWWRPRAPKPMLPEQEAAPEPPKRR